MNIAEIFEQAKRDMMSHGEHRPVVHVESALDGMKTFEFEQFPFRKTVDKQMALFSVGREYGTDHQAEEIRQVIFVSEAWVSHNPTYDFPDEDPERKECIILSVLDIDGRNTHQSGYTAEIVRQADIVDLLPHEKLDTVYNELLIAFLAGVASAKMNNEEFAQFITNYQ